MSRIEFLSQVRETCRQHTTPGMEAAWQPIFEQLNYLVAFENGDDVDRSLLENIDIGLRALRNLEDVYPNVAKLLFEVQRNAEAMAVENGMKNRIAL